MKVSIHNTVKISCDTCNFEGPLPIELASEFPKPCYGGEIRHSLCPGKLSVSRFKNNKEAVRVSKKVINELLLKMPQRN